MYNLSSSIVETTRAGDKILFTAHDLFYRDGIRATGLDRLIAESNVTKTTFYRHFSNKKNLIMEFLELRHQNWLAWFQNRFEHHGRKPSVIHSVINEWLLSENFRGYAFLNSVGEHEHGEEMSEVFVATQRHKQDVIDAVLPIVGSDENALAVAIDGATLKAQCDQNAKPAVTALKHLVRAIAK